MATSSNRDVKMTLSVETLGEDGIQKLEGDIRTLAKGAGEAAPEFERLANEVGQLAAQAGAVRGLEQLASEVERLGTEQGVAAQKATELKERLEAQRAAVTQATQAQAQQAQALLEARNALTQTNAELQKLRGTTDAAGKATETYKNELAALIDRKAAEQKAIDAARVALSAANKELGDATREQTKLTGQSERAAKALTTVEKALSDQNTALAQARGAVEQYGLSADDLAGTQARLVQSLNTAGTSAQQLAQQQRQAAQANADYEASLRSVQQATEDETRAQQAFLNSFNEAERIRQAAEYVQFWEQALRSAEAEQTQYAQDMRELETLIEQVGQAAAQEKAQVEAFNRSFDEARKAREAAEYIQFWNRSLEELERPAREAQERVRQVGEALNTLGRASVSDVQREIERVNNALETLRRESGLSGAELAQAMKTGQLRVQELQREIRELNGQLTLADRAASLFKNSLGQIAAGNLIADAVGALVERVKDLGRSFFTANIEIERLTRTMTLVTGSSEAAAEKIGFLREVANLAGQSVGQVTDSFIRFQASALAAGISTERVDLLFKQTVVSAGKLGLSSEQVAGSLEAISQIASKGVVSLEELRGQLGDRYPAALSIAAKGFGYTTQEIGKFTKEVESGKVTADAFFAAFRKGLEDFAGSADTQVEGLTQAFNRLKNAFTQFAQTAQDSAFIKALTSGLDSAANGVKSLAENIDSAIKAVTSLGAAFVGLKVAQFVAEMRLAAVATGTTFVSGVASAATAAGVTLVGALGRGAAAARAFWVALGGPIGAIIVGLTSLIPYYEDIYNWLIRQTEAGKKKAEQEALAAKAREQQAAAEKAAAVEKAKRDEEEVLRAAAAIRKINEKSAEIGKGLVLAEKAVKTAEEEAKALEILGKQIGDEAESRRLSLRATEQVLAARRQEVAQSEIVVESLQKQIFELGKVRDSNGNVTQAVFDQIKVVREKLALQRESLARSEEEVKSAENEANARRIASETYADNSARVNELREAYIKARQEYEKLASSGVASSDQLTAAAQRLARATALYADAADDARKKQDLLTKSKSLAVEASIAGLQIELEEARNWETRAKRLGDEEGARRALIRQKEIELEITKLQIELQRIEAQGSLDLAKAKLKEAEARGVLTPTLKLELELEIKVAEIKLKQADARGRATERMVEEIQALRSAKKAVDDEADSVDGNTASWNENIKAREKAIQLAKAARGEFAYDAQGFRMEADGSRSAYTVSNNDFIPDGLPNGQFNTNRLTQGQIMENIARNGGKFNPNEAYGGLLGGRKAQNGIGSNTQQATGGSNQLAEAKAELARYGVGVSDNATLQEVLRLLAEKKSAPSPTVPRTIKIEIGRSTTTVNVASDADAAALEAIFRQLETAAGRGG